MTDPLRVFEFFAGIGGMRMALSVLDIPTSTLAYEISLACCSVYKQNFDDNIKTKLVEVQIDFLHTFTIQQIKVEDVDGKADLWTMSPPCQPFTKTPFGAQQRDIDDARCKGLKHIMYLLQTCENPPAWIFLENVKNFHGSKMESEWKKALSECGYTWKSYCLSPKQIGIPNSRTRFYMACERTSRFAELSEVIMEFPEAGDMERPRRKISEYLLKIETVEDLLISKEMLEKKWAGTLPVVTPNDDLTYCFTSLYSRQVHQSTGSVLLMDTDDNTKTALTKASFVEAPDKTAFFGKIRKFSPEELLRIFGFPDNFKFPEELNLRLRWKLVGNSLSVSVVSLLLKDLILNSNLYLNHKTALI